MGGEGYYTVESCDRGLHSLLFARKHERQKKMPDSPSEMLAELINEENILVDLDSAGPLYTSPSPRDRG